MAPVEVYSEFLNLGVGQNFELYCFFLGFGTFQTIFWVMPVWAVGMSFFTLVWSFITGNEDNVTYRNEIKECYFLCFRIKNSLTDC